MKLPNKLTRTAPERIWLQCSDDPHDVRSSFADCEAGEITWSRESVLAAEVEYVRADTVEDLAMLGPTLKVRGKPAMTELAETDENQRPGFPLHRLVGLDAVWPAPKGNRHKLVPGPWMPGEDKPKRPGRYLRYFDDLDDCAISIFTGMHWTKDGFWRSDIQDAPWRGAVKPNAQVKRMASEAGQSD